MQRGATADTRHTSGMQISMKAKHTSSLENDPVRTTTPKNPMKVLAFAFVHAGFIPAIIVSMC